MTARWTASSKVSLQTRDSTDEGGKNFKILFSDCSKAKHDNTMFSMINYTNPKSSREEVSALTEDNVENEYDSEHQIVCQKSFQTGEPAIICDV